jgi:hypothetical protein
MSNVSRDEMRPKEPRTLRDVVNDLNQVGYQDTREGPQRQGWDGRATKESKDATG